MLFHVDYRIIFEQDNNLYECDEQKMLMKSDIYLDFDVSN